MPQMTGYEVCREVRKKYSPLVGIPEDKLERIFESFEQADGSTAREYGGTFRVNGCQAIS